MPRPRLLIVKPGTAGPALVGEHGDYENWFMEVLGDPARFTVAELHRGEKLPNPAGFDGVIVTGSPLSVVDPAPWMVDLGDALRDHAEAGGALLGVCFGHQLLSHAFGAPVILNPKGREIGTVDVALTAAGREDVLFEGLGPVLRVQETHGDIASRLPEAAILLAGNERSPIQALRFGRRARGVQFHPEMRPCHLRAILAEQGQALRQEGLDPAALESGLEESLSGRRILERFEERLVGG